MNSHDVDRQRMVLTRPNIIVLCMHKAASTFVADVLLPSIAVRTAEYDLCNVGSLVILYREQVERATGKPPAWATQKSIDQLVAYLSENPLPRSNGLFGRVYPRHLKAIENSLGIALPHPDFRLAVVRRDPRDALVSLYYSLAVSHDVAQVEGNPENFRRDRDQLQSKSACDGIKSLLKNARTDLTIPEFDICTQLLLDHPAACDLPYELLINQPEQWLTRFLQFGDLEKYVDDQWLPEMLSHLRPPELEDPTQHKRRMRPGNWVHVFDDELRAMLEERVGPRMRQFGYSWNDAHSRPHPPSSAVELKRAG